MELDKNKLKQRILSQLHFLKKKRLLVDTTKSKSTFITVLKNEK